MEVIEACATGGGAEEDKCGRGGRGSRQRGRMKQHKGRGQMQQKVELERAAWAEVEVAAEG